MELQEGCAWCVIQFPRKYFGSLVYIEKPGPLIDNISRLLVKLKHFSASNLFIWKSLIESW